MNGCCELRAESFSALFIFTNAQAKNGAAMSKQHNAGFLALVADAKSRIKEITIDEFQQHQPTSRSPIRVQ